MHKNRIFALLFLLAGLVCVGMDVPHAFAQSPTFESYLPSQESLRTGTFISMVLDAINGLAWIAFDLIDKLLDPQFIFNDLGGNNNSNQIYKVLNDIWVLSRNLMNIVFAVVLVIAAIYTTMKADLSLVKENMGRFVLAVVLVNFSWLFPLMVLDLSNVMTSFVYGLPNEIGATAGSCKVPDTKNGGTKTCQIVKHVFYFPESEKKPGEDCSNEKTLKSRPFAEGDCGYKCYFGIVCYKTVDWTANTPGYKSVINGLVYNYGRLGDIARLPNTAAPTASSSNIQLWVMFIIRQLISIVMMIALAFPLMALALAFLMRIPILWVTIAFMPFFFAGWVLEGKIPGAEKTKGILDEFIKAAFLPVITALPLTIGFIMMNALASTNWTTLADKLSGRAPIVGGTTTFFDIMWMCLALGIMWKGTFMALESGGMAGQFGSWFKGMGEAIGKIGVLAPLQIPAIPVGGKKMGIWGAAQQLNPKKWATALQYGTSFQDALGQVQGKTKPVTHKYTDEEKTTVRKKIEETNTAADKGVGVKDLEQTLERITGAEIHTQEQMLEVIRDLRTQGVIESDRERDALLELAKTHYTPGAVPPPAAPAGGGAAGAGAAS